VSRCCDSNDQALANAINTAMLEELLEHLRTAREDDAVRVLVISSSDHMGLSAGADIREQLDQDGRLRRMQLFADLYDAIVAFPKPSRRASSARTKPCASARLKRLLHDWDDVEGRSRAEGEGQIEWQRSGAGPPLGGLMARLQGRRRRPCDSAGNE
jgi:Enoyl-CoA hydratase/isomerase